MLYLLRHGMLEDGADRRFVGQLDLPLSPRGREQAAAWRERFLASGIEFAHVWSSDLERCRETARIVAPGRDVLYSRELREMNLGEWEDRPRDEIRREHPELWERRGKDPSLRLEGGESWSDLERRSVPAIDSMAAEDPGKNALVVTHSGVIRAYICKVLEIPWKNRFLIRLDYAGLSLLDNGAAPLRLVRLNLVPE